MEMKKITKKALVELEQQIKINKNDPAAQSVMEKDIGETGEILRDLNEQRKFPPGFFQQIIRYQQ